jgi:hypothetical protein
MQLAETTNNPVLALKARDLLLGRFAIADMAALQGLLIQKVSFTVFVIQPQVFLLSAGTCIRPHNTGNGMYFCPCNTGDGMCFCPYNTGDGICFVHTIQECPFVHIIQEKECVFVRTMVYVIVHTLRKMECFVRTIQEMECVLSIQYGRWNVFSFTQYRRLNMFLSIQWNVFLFIQYRRWNVFLHFYTEMSLCPYNTGAGMLLSVQYRIWNVFLSVQYRRWNVFFPYNTGMSLCPYNT